MSLLVLENLTKDYANADVVTSVLRGITLTVAEGEFVALMGPSGSGKSTLMHVLGFLDRPTSGAHRFRDREVAALTDDEQAAMRGMDVGFVFQAFHLLPRLTALENVMLPMAYADVPIAERRTRASRALAEVGLADRATFLPTRLSGGQKQRVAIARALVNNPSLILADEPTGNLDSGSSAQILTLLQSLNRAGKTIVMVTHEMDAANYASRIVRMKDGVIVDSYARF